MDEPLTHEEECDRLLEIHDHRVEGVLGALDSQFQTIHNRAEILLGICGILISSSVLITTGRIIGRPAFTYERLAGVLLIAAGALEVMTAAILVAVVLRVRWLTQRPGREIRTWVIHSLGYRDGKTRSYRLCMALLLVSMVLYQVAVSVALIQL